MTLKITGHDDLVRIIREAPEKSTQLKRRTGELVTQRFLFLIDQFAPTNKGEYKKSWQVLEFTDDYVIIGIPPGTKHTSGIDMNDLFIVLEFGIDREITITVKKAKSLKFESHGETIFRQKVTLPPRPPRPHARTAYDDTVRDWLELADQALMETFPYLKKA